jgi:hypothetical protein
MTSLAFVLGVAAAGVGERRRRGQPQALGTAVFGGMIAGDRARGRVRAGLLRRLPVAERALSGSTRRCS